MIKSVQAKKIIENVLLLLDPSMLYTSLIKYKSDSILIDGKNIKIPSTIHLFSVGKAASFEISALKKSIEGSELNTKIFQTVSLTKEDHLVDDSQILQIEGDHPYLTQRNITNTLLFIELLRKIEPEHGLIFLLSGGASALLELPDTSVDFSLMQTIYKDLVNSGENIDKINQVRKAISQVKNGGLLSYIGSKNIIQFITSDIPGDDISMVGSAPLIKSVLDEDYVEMKLAKYNIHLSVKNTPQCSEVVSILSQSLGKLVEKLGKIIPEIKYLKTYNCSLEEALDDLLLHLPEDQQILVSGGEANVFVPDNIKAKGGRNTHFVLSMATRLYQDPQSRNIHILSLGTDGTDGPTDAAGAYINYQLFRENSDPNYYLENFKSYEYFEKLGTLIRTGPTGSNIMDIRCVWRE